MNILKQLDRKEVKWFVAELIGTFFLSATVGIAIVGRSNFPSTYSVLYVPSLVGAVIAAMVYVFGWVSGAHFNPAASFSLWLVQRIHTLQLAVHIVAQVIGAYLGVWAITSFLSVTPSMILASTSTALMAEVVGTFILLLAVTAVTIGKIKEDASGAAVGLALMIGVTISLIPSGGVLNPAIMLAFGGFKIGYVLAPLVGGSLGALLITWLAKEGPVGRNTKEV